MGRHYSLLYEVRDMMSICTEQLQVLLAAKLALVAQPGLLGGLSDLLEHKLGDFMGEGGSHGQQARLGLVAVLVGHESHLNRGVVRSGVAENIKYTVKKLYLSY